ncbi:MAG: CHAP domain-containing protein [Acidimicrobiales bacterium]
MTVVRVGRSGLGRAVSITASVLVVALTLLAAASGSRIVPLTSGSAVLASYPDQGVLDYGSAVAEGDPTAETYPSPVVAMAETADGKGYWLATADGTVTAFGDAQSYGGVSDVNLNAPIVGMAATPDGKGYWLVALDGGVFSFGDAQFYGSTGAMTLNKPIVGMAATADGKGYWLVAADGGIFSFGDAQFYGSEGGTNIPGFVSGMAATPDGAGYWLANANGDVYPFGDAKPFGNNLGSARTEPIAAIVSTPHGNGYRLLEPDAFDVSFDHPGPSDSIVALAASQIVPDPDPGYFCNPYGPCEEWCALFATWVWANSGIPIPSLAFVGFIYDWAAANTQVLPPSATPSPGDLVLYGTGPANVSTAVHTGVVAQVWPDGAIDTIEGDAGPANLGSYNVVINGPYLPSDSDTYNGSPIFGFAVP